MSRERLTALDASFLEVESSSAHMHVGWAALFAPPAGGAAPSFDDLREHIAARLSRAPRYPVVPLADNHGVSIGMTTVAGEACFGVYADAETVPDADLLATSIAESVDELGEVSANREEVRA